MYMANNFMTSGALSVSSCVERVLYSSFYNVNMYY